MFNKHHTKIVKLLSKAPIEKRLSIVENYIDKFNRTSENHGMSFIRNILKIYRIDCGYRTKELSFDLTQYFDKQSIRDELLDDLLKEK